MTNRILIALMAAALLAGCGGGGGGGSTSTPTPPPVNTPPPADDDDDVATDPAEAVAFGRISRFGSVVVNGAVFGSDAATVTINDTAGVTSDLRVGQIVAVTASLGSSDQSAVAQRIDALDELEGPVISIDSDNDSFVVLGHNIFVDELTVLESLGFDDLAEGNVVRIYGYRRSGKRIQATHVERIADAFTAGMRISVKGPIESFDPFLLRFRVGNQLSDYSGAELDLGNAELADGLYVEVLSSSPIDDGIITLDRVVARDRDADRGRDGECASGCAFGIEGYITDFTSATDFVVDGAPVTTNGSTEYFQGTSDSLAQDVQVAVSGTPNGSGVIVADRIGFAVPSNVEIEANIDAIDVETGSLTVLGINVLTDEFTIARDVSESAVVNFWLDDLAIGDRAEIRAKTVDASITATRLERDDADDQVTLKAPVGEIARPSLTLLGVTVTAGAGTQFLNEADEPVDEDTFFGLVEAGGLVEAEGEFNGAAISADTLSIADCGASCL